MKTDKKENISFFLKDKHINSKIKKNYLKKILYIFNLFRKSPKNVRPRKRFTKFKTDWINLRQVHSENLESIM